MTQEQTAKTIHEQAEQIEKEQAQQINFEEMLEQLQNSIQTGVENITNEINNNQLLIETIEKSENKEALQKLIEATKEQKDNLEQSLTLMVKHLTYAKEVLQACKEDEKVLANVKKLLQILVRK